MFSSADSNDVRHHLPRPALARLGLWFDPVGFVRRLLLRCVFVVLPFALLAAAAVGWWAQGHFASSYGVSSILRIRPQSDPPAVLADMEPYRVPTFSPREIEAWFRAWPVMQEAYVSSGRDDGVGVLRALTSISYERESGRLHFSYRGARSIDHAIATTIAMTEGVVSFGRQQIAERVERDLSLHRRRLMEARQTALQHEERLTAFSTETGILDSDQALRIRADAVHQSQQALEDAQRALTHLDQRLRDLPAVIASLPREVAGSRSLIDDRARSLEALRDRLRSMRTQYAATNPILLQAEEELVEAESVALAAHQTVSTRPDTMMRNPVLDDLAREKATLILDRPQLLADVAHRSQALNLAVERRNELPELMETFYRYKDAVTSSRALLKRLDARLIEIRMVRERVQSPLEIIEAPHDGAVSESSRFKKVAVVSGASFMASFSCFAAGLVIYLLWRDTRVRTAADARYAFLTSGAMGPPRKGELGPWSRRLCDQVTTRASSAMVVASDPQTGATTALEMAAPPQQGDYVPSMSDPIQETMIRMGLRAI